MNTKICGKCKEDLPIENFSKKSIRKDDSIRYQPYCKKCVKEYKDIHYTNNKKYYISKAKKNRIKVRNSTIIKLLEYFKTHPCVDCGESNPLVLEFDHIGNKEFNISYKLGNGLSWIKLMKEIDKCEVRCANCHKIKTAKQFNWTMLQMMNIAPVV